MKAIIFDCFGVLVTEAWLPFKTERFGHNKELFEEASSLNQQADAGLISHEQFVSQIAGMTGLTEAEVNGVIDNNAQNLPLFAYIKELKSDYKIGMLSNAAANWLEELFTADQLELFDAISLSYESGIAKPAGRAYEIIADKLGVLPEECVLVDDQERHCAGAWDSGMKAIVYKDFQQMKNDLEKLLANPKS